MICQPLTVALIVVFHGVAGKPLRGTSKGRSKAAPMDSRTADPCVRDQERRRPVGGSELEDRGLFDMDARGSRASLRHCQGAREHSTPRVSPPIPRSEDEQRPDGRFAQTGQTDAAGCSPARASARLHCEPAAGSIWARLSAVGVGMGDVWTCVSCRLRLRRLRARRGGPRRARGRGVAGLRLRRAVTCRGLRVVVT